MTPSTKNRRLAAIVFADIVGYAAMMQRSEAEGLATVTHYRTVLADKVATYHGEILQHYGDGTLFIFSSGVSAVKCAKELQETFRGFPLVPLRIGIHIGDIVINGKDIYGDGVNLTSRVESLGVSGAVLFTSRLLPDLKSHPELKIAFLGRFELKNIEEPVEVYALANEGFPIPKRSEMKGKLASWHPQKIKRILGYAAVVLTLIASLWFWQDSKNTLLISDDFPGDTPEPNEIKDKRVAVMAFDNQTNQENLSSLGIMASDWLTQGLMEVGGVPVVSSANMIDKLSMAGAGLTASQAFAKKTRAEVIIKGRYYQQGEKLFIHCNIIAANGGRVLHALNPIVSTEANAMQALETLKQKVLTVYKLSDNSKYTKRIPNYEAYKASLAANKYFYTNTKKVEGMLLQAYELDTSFMEPLIKLAKYYSTRRKFGLCDSLLTVIQSKDQPLTGFEKLRLEAIAARNKGLFEQSGQLNLQIAQEYDANFYNNAMGRFLAGNNIQKAKELTPFIINLQDIGQIGIRQEGTLFRPLFTQYRLGNYEEVMAMMDTVFQNEKNVLKINTIPTTHIRASLEMGDLEAADRLLKFYLNKDNKSVVFSNRNSPKTILRWYAYDKYRLGQPISEEVKQMMRDEKLNFELDYVEESYEKYLPHVASRLKKYPNSKYWLAIMGQIYGYQGKHQTAEKWITRIKSTPATYKKGDNAYHEGVVRASMGQLTEAIALLKLAHQRGYDFSTISFQHDPGLKPLYNHPQFQEFVNPKID